MLAVLAGSVVFAGAASARADESPTYASAVVVDVSAAFVPFANDVPLMLGAGIRFARFHEIWARAGYMPTGDDVHLGFGVVGYRAALRPGKVVRPIFGGLAAAVPETCGHDAQGKPSCERVPLFIFAATAGVRIEPTPWIGLFGEIAFGVDSYPNPFGMIEAGVSFVLPLS